MGIKKATNPSTNNARRKCDRNKARNHTSSSSVFLSCGSKESISKLWLDDGIFGSFEATEQSHNNNLTYIIFSTSRGTFCNVLWATPTNPAIMGGFRIQSNRDKITKKCNCFVNASGAQISLTNHDLAVQETLSAARMKNWCKYLSAASREKISAGLFFRISFSASNAFSNVKSAFWEKFLCFSIFYVFGRQFRVISLKKNFIFFKRQIFLSKKSLGVLKDITQIKKQNKWKELS